jgi:putative oxidoreductase
MLCHYLTPFLHIIIRIAHRMFTLPPFIQTAKLLAGQVAPLAARIPLGIVFIAHGMDKLWNSFGGGGLEATIQQFTELGLYRPDIQAQLAGWGELLGGILVLVGLFTRFGGMLLTGTMVVAIITVHLSGGLFARDGGFEYPLVILGTALSLIASGGGLISIDALLFPPTKQPQTPTTPE